MSREDKKYYYYAEITIEAVSPLVLASGKSGNFFDVELVRDANGLPVIPGSTVAGILRHAVQKEIDQTTVNQLFGYQTKEDGCSSSLEVSWAYIHDSNNQIHKSFYPISKIEEDPILRELSKSDSSDFKRDHVNLTEKGVAKESGKFDRSFVPAGCRFSFSLGLWSETDNDDNWNIILSCLFRSSFRIGAAGRAGYGKIKIIEIQTPSNAHFDLSNPQDIESFKVCTKKYDISKFNDGTEQIQLKLSFPLGFRIGGGLISFLNSKHLPDIRPYSEKIIKWTGENGGFEDKRRITIPGSAIKGALRHRAAYHLARINKNWDSKNDSDVDDGLSDLFGFVTESESQSGKLWFTDLYLDETNTYQLSRNSIDRFTGGTMPGALFQEENVFTNEIFETYIYLDKTIKKDSDEFKAFEWAVEDLKAGRLALGGGAGHGLGFNNVEERK